uniref:Uncharacterized protein n=1 Tax=Rhizophora mucronata TaxID=61149 RepID=A0A2P2J197_RHIMU
MRETLSFPEYCTNYIILGLLGCLVSGGFVAQEINEAQLRQVVDLLFVIFLLHLIVTDNWLL